MVGSFLEPGDLWISVQWLLCCRNVILLPVLPLSSPTVVNYFLMLSCSALLFPAGKGWVGLVYHRVVLLLQGKVSLLCPV